MLVSSPQQNSPRRATLTTTPKVLEKVLSSDNPANFVEAARSVARDILREYTLQFGNGRQPQAVREQVERNVLEALEWRKQKQQEELV